MSTLLFLCGGQRPGDRRSTTVTLYKEQWQKLFAMADDIRAFLKENTSD